MFKVFGLYMVVGENDGPRGVENNLRFFFVLGFSRVFFALVSGSPGVLLQNLMMRSFLMFAACLKPPICQGFMMLNAMMMNAALIIVSCSVSACRSQLGQWHRRNHAWGTAKP